MSSYREYDSFTADDGTKYVAKFKKGRNIIQKVDADGKTTTLSSSKGGTTSSNKARVASVFDSFKAGLESAKSGTNISYSDEDVTPGGGGGLFGGSDKYTTVSLSDGTTLKSAAGKTADEVRTVKRLADEVANYSSLINTAETTKKDEEETTVLDEKTDSALDKVEEISVKTFDPDLKQDIGNYYDNTVTSDFTAAGGQTNMESALTTSVGEAEDDAISNMTKGIKGNVLTTAQGLLSNDDDEDLFRGRRSLIGS